MAGGSGATLNAVRMANDNAIKKVYAFYRDGFRSMTVGRTLWLLIAIKLFIMFAILKIFFFPDFLKQFKSDAQRGDYVRRQFIERTTHN